MANEKKEFSPEEHLIELRGKDYLPVAWRVAWFRHDHPAESGWGIHTEVEALMDEKVRCKAEIIDPEGRTIAMGRKTESKANFTDYVEKAETGAVGRALALCGYGTQFAPELDEEERIVDSPQERNEPKEEKKVSSKQRAKIFALGGQLGLESEETKKRAKKAFALESFNDMTSRQASALIKKMEIMIADREEESVRPGEVPF